MLFSNSPKTPSIQLFWRRTVLVQLFLVLNCPTLGRLHKKAWQKNNQIDLKWTAAVHLILKEIHFLRDNVTTMQVFISNVVKFTKTKSTHFSKRIFIFICFVTQNWLSLCNQQTKLIPFFTDDSILFWRISFLWSYFIIVQLKGWKESFLFIWSSLGQSCLD